MVQALGATFLATSLLARASLKCGILTDSRAAGEAWRKPREGAVALVGGAAVLIGLWVSGAPLPWAALLAAFVLGTWDDARPLSAIFKLLGQVGVGCWLASWMGWHGWNYSAGVLAVVAAQNAMNTWDHADGLCAGLVGVGLPPVLAAPFLGFLPWNLLLMRRRADSSAPGVPWAYLGDAGSHISGVLMVWYEPARPLLLLPLLDLARVACLRIMAGQRFWVGDRRHLGHRLLDAGFEPKSAALLALAPALPLAATDRLGMGLAALVCLCMFAGLVIYTAPGAQVTKDPGK